MLPLLLLGVAVALYAYATRHFGYWRAKGVPFVRPLPFVGNLKDVFLFRKHISDVLRETYTKMQGQRYIGMYYFDQPVLLLKDRSIIKAICHKDFEHFNERALLPAKSDPLNREALNGIAGKPWKDLRVKLTPIFSSGKLKKVYAQLEEKAKHLGTYFDDAVRKGRPCDVQEACGRYCTDAITSVCFGLEGRALVEPNDPLYRMLHSVFVFSKVYVLSALALFARVPLLRLLDVALVPQPLARFLRRTVWRAVAQRQRSGQQGARGDFLDLLMELRASGAEGAAVDVDGDVLIAQVYRFLSDGYETAATTMSFALYHLAQEEAIQDQLRTQLQNSICEHDGTLTYEALQSVAYLDMIVAETLRLYPVLPFLDRVCTKPYRVEGSDLVIDKGVVVFGCTIGIQRDPALYPDPNRFNPERFSETNKAALPRNAFMPFGEGRRMCIGFRLGLLQTKVGLAHIILNYRLRPCSETPCNMEFDLHTFVLHPRNGVILKFSRISEYDAIL